MAEPEVVTIKPKGGRRAVVIGIVVVVVLAGAGIGYAVTSGGKKKTPATVSTAANGTANGQRRNGVFGTLASITGDTLLVTDQNGVKTTVHTNSSTVYLTTATGALSDVKVGDRLTAMGTNAGTNQISATRVNDTSGMDAINGQGNGPGNGQGGPPGGRRFANGNGNGANANNPNAPAAGTFAFGTVSSINGNIILVKDTNGTVTTVDTTAATTFSVVKRIALTDLATGQQVRVNGPKAADGSVTATAVQEGTGGFGGFGRRGGGNGNGGTTATTTGTGG